MPARLRTIADALNPAGGLVYHWRAWRYGALWQPFAAALKDWLERWMPACERAGRDLLLVGPSAGYCLPGDWLMGFRALDGIEPDPLARALFARRTPRLRERVRWHPGLRVDLDPGADQALLDRFPDHAVLFCNLLGQIGVLRPGLGESRHWRGWQERVASRVAGRRWASFHDRLSGIHAPDLSWATEVQRGLLSDGELAQRCFRSAAQVPRRVVALDSHCCEGLFPDAERRYLIWQLTGSRYHLIEAACDGAASAAQESST